eukprot:4361254-Pleurochrysis_carterae.AAC.1
MCVRRSFVSQESELSVAKQKLLEETRDLESERKAFEAHQRNLCAQIERHAIAAAAESVSAEQRRTRDAEEIGRKQIADAQERVKAAQAQAESARALAEVDYERRISELEQRASEELRSARHAMERERALERDGFAAALKNVESERAAAVSEMRADLDLAREEAEVAKQALSAMEEEKEAGEQARLAAEAQFAERLGVLQREKGVLQKEKEELEDLLRGCVERESTARLAKEEAEARAAEAAEAVIAAEEKVLEEVAAIRAEAEAASRAAAQAEEQARAEKSAAMAAVAAATSDLEEARAECSRKEQISSDLRQTIDQQTLALQSMAEDLKNGELASQMHLRTSAAAKTLLVSELRDLEQTFHAQEWHAAQLHAALEVLRSEEVVATQYTGAGGACGSVPQAPPSQSTVAYTPG